MQILDGQIILSASDLVGHLACAHLTVLEGEAARGRRVRPVRLDPALDVIQARGFQLEERYLSARRKEGLTVRDLDSAPPRTLHALRAADAATLEAMRAGYDVIAQATFFDGRWQGRADFLTRTARPSALGRWSYDVADSKLSRTVKGGALLQLCLYAHQLERLQGVPPEWLSVVTGDGATHAFRFADYAAYFGAVRRRFEETLARGGPDETYPEPVEHCRVCRWWAVCADRRRADDHLCLVAGMSRAHTAQLRAASIGTVTALGTRPRDAPPVPGLRDPVLETLRDQARLQLQQYADGQIRYELLPVETDQPGRGLGGLPAPSPGDLFLDLEAHPWAGDDGLEYLLGVVTETAGAPVYSPRWAHSGPEERDAFDGLMAEIFRRRALWPDMHVYHYGGYESGALKRLMGRHAIREDDLDVLLRGKVLVDLHSVVRQGLRVSEESYSLKKIEKLYGMGREGPVTHPGFALVAYEEWLESGRTEILDQIAAYNRDDCVSIWRLRTWLEERRGEAAAALGSELPRPAVADGAAGEEASRMSEEMQQRIERLRTGTAVGAAGRTDGQRARWLLSNLVDFHRREEKPQWWRYFDLVQRPMPELIAASDALGALEYERVVDTEKKSFVHRYRYDPGQEHPFKPGDDPVDPADEGNPGQVVAVDRIAGSIDLKRGIASARPHPRALVPGRPVPIKPLRAALCRLADHVIASGIDGPGPYRAVRDLLLGRPPRVRGVEPGAPLLRAGDDALGAARRLVAGLDESCLPVQGPPGCGKTYTGARMILDLVRAGRRVGITANAHKAITNMIAALLAAAEEEGTRVSIARKANGDDESDFPGVTRMGDNSDVAAALRAGTCTIAAGTAWLFAAPEMAGLVDTLFVDEAGQMSLATAVAAGTSARSLVLLGDPNQLPQVTQGTHPDGAGGSALEHVLGADGVLAAERGLFLPETRRLHPDLCRYVSDAFYESQLSAHTSTHGQGVGPGSRCGTGAGIVLIPVLHHQDGARSTAEAHVAAEVVRELLTCSWTDQHGRSRLLTPDDLLLVAPYNAQVAELQRVVRERLRFTPRAGTVDKFQGQEGAVVIYSLTTSSPEDAPRNLEFLYSRHRLNVAVSRARCFAVVLYSPDLFDVSCRTPELMHALNAFWQLVEASRPLTAAEVVSNI
jgi:predicted RecB family nuclease